MPYRFATENSDNSDFAAGRVFYSLPGQPALPIRLASEIWQRCWAVRQAQGHTEPASLYDPCCGSGYHLAALAFLHRPHLREIVASDVDGDALRLAMRNLALVNPAGLEARAEELAARHAQFGKDSHADALASARRLRARLPACAPPLETATFPADATRPRQVAAGLSGRPVDIVLADVPYGGLSAWQMTTRQMAQESADPPPPLWQMLDALAQVLAPSAVVAITADKSQNPAHPAFRRVERFQIGKRRVTILQKAVPA